MSRSLDDVNFQPQSEGVFLDEDDGDETKIDSRFAPCSPLWLHLSPEVLQPRLGFNRDTQHSSGQAQEHLKPTSASKLSFKPWDSRSSPQRQKSDRSESPVFNIRLKLKSEVHTAPIPVDFIVCSRLDQRLLSQELFSNAHSPTTRVEKLDIDDSSNLISELSPDFSLDAPATASTIALSTSDQTERNIVQRRASLRTAVIKELLRRFMKNWAAIQKRQCAELSTGRTAGSHPIVERPHYQAPSVRNHSRQSSLGSGNERAVSPEIRWEADLMASMQLSSSLSPSSSADLKTRPGANTKSFFMENAGDSTSSTSKKAASASNSSPSTPEKRLSKQKKIVSGNRRPEDDEDYEEGQGRPPKKSKSESKSTAPDVHLLACPYWILDPPRYSEQNTIEKNYRGCSSCYLTDIARLKQHLYRVHQRPKNLCPRCSTLFVSSQDLDSHLRATVACEPCEPVFPERFSESQSKELKRRWPRENVTGSWMRIWRILFPGVTCPDSPYLEQQAEKRSAEVQPPHSVSVFIADFRTRAPGFLQEILRDVVQPPQSMNISTWLQTDEAGFILEESVERLLCRIAPGMSARRTAAPPKSGDLQLSEFTWIDHFYDLPQFDLWADFDFDKDFQNPEDEDFSGRVLGSVLDGAGDVLNAQPWTGDALENLLESWGPENTSPSPVAGTKPARRSRRGTPSTRSARVS